MSLQAEISLQRDAFTLDIALQAGAGETLGLLGPDFSVAAGFRGSSTAGGVGACVTLGLKMEPMVIYWLRL